MHQILDLHLCKSIYPTTERYHENVFNPNNPNYNVFIFRFFFL
jgi:hypothetical protein